MTVSSQTSQETFFGNNATVTWPLPFRFFDNDDIQVLLVDPDTQIVVPMVIGTDYTLTGAGLPESFGTAPGSITTTVPVATGKELNVERVMPVEQLVDIINQGEFFPEIHEDVFDRLTMLIQQNSAGLGRALMRPPGKNYYDAQGYKISNLGTPTDTSDAATLGYVAALVAGIQGPISNATSVFYLGTDGQPYNVQDLSDTANPYKGVALTGRSALQINSVAELRATPGRFANDRAYLKGYLAGDKKGPRYLTWVIGPSTDDGGTTFGAAGGRWVSDLTEDGRIDVSFWGLPLASGFCNVEFAAIEAYMYANKISCNVGPGIFDFGPGKAPFTNGSTSAVFRDYGGTGLFSSTETTFQTTSPSGADVFNFVCVQGFNIWGYPTITAFLTGTLDSGSNGTSFVHGCKDMTIEANYKNLPFVDKGSATVDGGSAFTLQANATSLLPFENIIVRGTVKGASHGVTCSGTYEYFVANPVKNVVLSDLRVESAYRAVVISSTPPTVAPATPPHIGISGRVLAVNCQQVLFDARGDGVSLDICVMNTLVKESLNILPSDPLVSVARLLGAKNFKYNVGGEIRSADNLLQIGETSMGSGVTGDTANGVLHLNVKFNAVTNQISLINTGGLVISNNELHLNAIKASYAAIAARNSTLFINGQKVNPTIYPGDAGVTLQQNSFTSVVFKVPLTATRAVTLPATGNIGDVVLVVRLPAATGASAVQVLGVNYAVSTWAEFVFNGSAWERTKTGTT